MKNADETITFKHPAEAVMYLFKVMMANAAEITLRDPEFVEVMVRAEIEGSEAEIRLISKYFTTLLKNIEMFDVTITQEKMKEFFSRPN